MKITVHNGLLFWENGEVISCPTADRIARANGEFYAEIYVTKNDGKTITLHDKTLMEVTQK